MSPISYFFHLDIVAKTHKKRKMIRILLLLAIFNNKNNFVLYCKSKLYVFVTKRGKKKV